MSRISLIIVIVAISWNYSSAQNRSLKQFDTIFYARIQTDSKYNSRNCHDEVHIYPKHRMSEFIDTNYQERRMAIDTFSNEFEITEDNKLKSINPIYNNVYDTVKYKYTPPL